MGTLDRRAMEAALPGYELGAELGRGAFGVVYAARHRQLDREVAVKQLPRALAADPGVRDRFLTEARTVAALVHPHVVPVYDFVEHDGLHLLVMELLGGGSLADRLRSGPLDPAAAADLVTPVVDALAEAHARGVVHRDVKPDNVLLTVDGVPKLADFGIARIVGGSSTRTAAGTVVGTPAYVAPEVALGAEAGPAADVWAVGVVLYECVSGRLPHERLESPTATLARIAHDPPVPLMTAAPGVDPGFAALVADALAVDPAVRPTATDLATRLRAWRAGVVPGATPGAGHGGSDARSPRSRRRWPAVAAAAVLLAGAGIALAAAAAGGDPAASSAAGGTDPLGSTAAAAEVATGVAATGVAATGASAASATESSAGAIATDGAGGADRGADTTTAETATAETATAETTTAETTTAAPTGELADVVERFQTGCEGRGLLPSQCECMIVSLVEEFGSKRFITIANQLAADQPIRSDAQAVIASCLLAS